MDRRFFIIVLLFLVISVMIFYKIHFRDTQEISIDISKFPLTIGTWKGENTLRDKNIFDILETEDLIVREYIKDNNKVNLAIVYYGGKIEGFHRPEACFSGQGSELIDKELEEIKVNNRIVKVNKLIFKQKEQKRILWYFFYSKGYFTGNYKDFRWRLLLNELKGKKHGVAMVQISSTFRKDEEKAVENLKEFTPLLVPLLKKYLL